MASSSSSSSSLSSSSSPLYAICRSGDKEQLLRWTRKNGRESLLIKDPAFDQTLLHVTCEAGHYDLTVLLLDKFKLPTSASDKNGWTALHSAASQGHLGLCELLVDHGAFSPARTSEGTSALHYLCRMDVALKKHDFRRVVQKLLAGGLDPNCQNKHGLTPLHEAALRGSAAVVSVMLEFNVLVDVVTNQGETALIYAARANFPGVLNMLLDAGADASIAGSEGTALDVAVALMKREAARALRARVRDPCKMCGRPFFPLCFHVAAPSIWHKFTDEQKSHKAMRLSADLCQAHDDVFIRGIIVVPITSSTASAEISATYKAPRVLQNRPGQLYICFGVYVQVSRPVFDAYLESWTVEGREKRLAPAEGFVANTLPYWRSTMNTACMLLPQCVGCRPLVQLTDAAHPLFVAQRDGISFTEAEKIKNMLL